MDTAVMMSTDGALEMMRIMGELCDGEKRILRIMRDGGRPYLTWCHGRMIGCMSRLFGKSNRGFALRRLMSEGLISTYSEHVMGHPSVRIRLTAKGEALAAFLG